jgi:hypothetical protein
MRNNTNRRTRSRRADARYYFYVSEWLTRFYARLNGFIPDLEALESGRPSRENAAAIRAGWETARMKIEDPLWWEAGLAR